MVPSESELLLPVKSTASGTVPLTGVACASAMGGTFGVGVVALAVFEYPESPALLNARTRYS